jgi:hypothetical protein
MGFVKLEPASGKVSGTNSNMPLLVVPSLITNVGTLTLAEARSSRFYADEAKTIELPREVVSANEIHVKISSVTSTTDVYMDWDGVRADYAVTDTYGRNAVWSGFQAVYHMNQDPSGSAPQMIDSTGNGNNGTSVGSMTSGDLVAAKIGDGIDFDGSNDRINCGNDSSLNSTNIYAACWMRRTNSDFDYVVAKNDGGITGPWGLIISNTGRPRMLVWNGSSVQGTDYTGGAATTVNTWDYVAGTFDGSNIRSYVNGSLEKTIAGSFSLPTTTQELRLGNNSGGQWFTGRLDEIRVSGTAFSTDWISTEYQNQNDNGAFWVATPAGGGGSPTPTLMMMGVGV